MVTLDKTEAELSDRKKKQEKAEEEHNTEVTRWVGGTMALLPGG